MDNDTLQVAVDLGRGALLMAIKLSFPILIAGLIVGAVISVLQAATQIQEQSLNQVPKMFAVAAVVFLILPWLMTMLVDYTVDLVREMGTTLSRM
jgi:flagellar biosynthetic protein FliQ